MSYTVTIEETLSKDIVVHGVSSKEEAIKNVQEAYESEQIVLTADDYVSTDFSVQENNMDNFYCLVKNEHN
jgi:hypothetical protein